ncbi:hypothetical protein COU57_03275 [Candidatus Pacearchaeota archaeon CG10_big_fil_rev_8_21_14_0_10_32_14]|nr:MAG: hypothetical protein COU57_03275 [Candidatus Pacearchaeota archaeon CG10_big_fil_rev_8_21_14_0_10_32_14]
MIDFISIFLHVDTYLGDLISQFGIWTYLILFLIIFVETGVVIMPFLPGDSLLFIAGAFAAEGSLNLFYLLVLLSIAAIGGDSANYFIGKYTGEKIITNNWIKKHHLEKTENFYKKYGVKTIVLARFVPIVRTIAPFVAGLGKMEYKKFLKFNIIGGLAWVLLIVMGGYLLGTIPIVKANFEWIIFGIIVLSILPPIIEWIKERRKNKSISQ